MEEPTCEICGRKGVKAIVLVEGARLTACGGCARGKKILYFLEEREAPGGPVEVPRKRTEETEEIADDYAERIKKARQKMGLSTAVVAERINEMESYLDRIERGKITPTFAVAKKLEKELNIKLIEKVQPSIAPSAGGSKRFSEPTLGDMLEGQKKEED